MYHSNLIFRGIDWFYSVKWSCLSVGIISVPRETEAECYYNHTSCNGCFVWTSRNWISIPRRRCSLEVWFKTIKNRRNLAIFSNVKVIYNNGVHSKRAIWTPPYVSHSDYIICVFYVCDVCIVCDLCMWTLWTNRIALQL